MKKLIALALVLVMAFSLCGCALVKGKIEDVKPGETVQPPAETEKEPQAPQDEPAQPDEGPAELPTPEVSAPLYGNEPSNLAAGGYIAMSAEGQLFWSHAKGLAWGMEMPEGEEYGVFAKVGDSYEKISDDNACYLNVWGDRLYYVAQTWNGDEGTSQIVSVKLDGSDRKVVGETLPIKWEMRRSDDDKHAEYTHLGGYTDLIVYDGQLYFIADNGRSGGKDVHSQYMDMTYSTIWHSEKSVFRTDLEGGNKTVIVESLGNGDAHFTIGEEKLWYTVCHDAGATVYPHITLNSCNLDGSGAQLLYGTEDTADVNALHEIVGGLFYAEGYLFVSCSDSEGDFPHGRLMAYKDGQYEHWGDETYYVNYVYDGIGGLYNLFTTDEYVQYESSGMEYIENAELLCTALDHIATGAVAGEAKVLHEFGRINRWEDEFSHFELAVFDGGRLLVLLTENGAVYTLDLANGTNLARVEK